MKVDCPAGKETFDDDETTEKALSLDAPALASRPNMAKRSAT
jgi:hypothetical protein